MEILLLLTLLVFGTLAIGNILAYKEIQSLNQERDRLVMERMDMIHNEMLILSMAVWPDSAISGKQGLGYTATEEIKDYGH